MAESPANNTAICKLDSALKIIQCARLRTNTLEIQRTSIVESAAKEKDDAISRANLHSAVDRKEILGRSQVEKDELKGQIETLVRESDNQHLNITSVISDLTSKPQTSADAVKAILDYGISQGVVGPSLHNTRPATSIRVPAASTSRLSPSPPIGTTIHKSRATRVMHPRVRHHRGSPSNPSSGGSAPELRVWWP